MLLVAFSLIFLLALSNFRQQRAGITSLTFVDVYQRSNRCFDSDSRKMGDSFEFLPKSTPFKSRTNPFFLNPKNTETGG